MPSTPVVNAPVVRTTLTQVVMPVTGTEIRSKVVSKVQDAFQYPGIPCTYYKKEKPVTVLAMNGRLVRMIDAKIRNVKTAREEGEQGTDCYIESHSNGKVVKSNFCDPSDPMALEGASKPFMLVFAGARINGENDFHDSRQHNKMWIVEMPEFREKLNKASLEELAAEKVKWEAYFCFAYLHLDAIWVAETRRKIAGK